MSVMKSLSNEGIQNKRDYNLQDNKLSGDQPLRLQTLPGYLDSSLL